MGSLTQVLLETEFPEDLFDNEQLLEEYENNEAISEEETSFGIPGEIILAESEYEDQVLSKSISPPTYDQELQGNVVTAYQEQTIDGDSDRIMATTVTVVLSGPETGLIKGDTRISNEDNLQGYTGGVMLIFHDADGNTIGFTHAYSFGVDVDWLGDSERNEHWEEKMPESVMERMTSFEIIQEHDPTNRFTKLAGEVGLQIGISVLGNVVGL